MNLISRLLIRHYQTKVLKKNSMNIKFHPNQVFYKQNDLFKSLKSLKKIKNVSTTTFDNFFTKKQKIDFCKIDVQGEELKVLEGMKKKSKK